MIPNLWKHAPELRSRARKQAWRLRAEIAAQSHPHALTSERYAALVAHDVGYRAGRLMALRLEAYDRLQAGGGAP